MVIATERCVDVYETVYANRTQQMQSYTFATSCETIATAKIELQDSYTIGSQSNIEVGLLIFSVRLVVNRECRCITVGWQANVLEVVIVNIRVNLKVT